MNRRCGRRLSALLSFLCSPLLSPMPDYEKRERREYWLTMAALAAIVLFWGLLAFASARDLGQWENTDPELRVWFQALRQPDNPNVSCCGEADAFWCDDVYANDKGTFCKITDTRDDTELRRPHVPVGTEIWIPPNKFGPGKWGNPTGHTVVFLSFDLKVYCWVQQGGV